MTIELAPHQKIILELVMKMCDCSKLDFSRISIYDLEMAHAIEDYIKGDREE